MGQALQLGSRNVSSAEVRVGGKTFFNDLAEAIDASRRFVGFRTVGYWVFVGTVAAHLRFAAFGRNMVKAEAFEALDDPLPGLFSSLKH